jgi:hypothetical protein
MAPVNVPGETDASLDDAILVALDGLLRALELESFGPDRFRVLSEPGRFDRVFGGQLLAQALLAAGATVTDKAPQSLHAYFVDGGTPETPLEVAVDRVRDGRSMSTRRVTVLQGERPRGRRGPAERSDLDRATTSARPPRGRGADVPRRAGRRVGALALDASAARRR